MDDTFNRTQRSIPYKRHRLYLNDKPDTSKRARLVHSNMITHQTCVARHEEPMFSPSDGFALASTNSLLHTASSANIPNTNNTSDDRHENGHENGPNDIDDDDDADDDDGGVSLIPIECEKDGPTLQIMRGADNNESEDTGNRTSAAMSSVQEELDPSLMIFEGASEQEGSDLGMALASHEGIQTSPLPREGTANTSFSASRPSLFDRISNDRSANPADAASQSHSAAPSAEITQALVDMVNLSNDADPELNDDYLAVDDPQRHYDFAEFMDHWRFRSLSDKHLPRFEPGIQSSIRLGRPTESLSRRDIADGTVDMQGIRWKLVGPSRKDAIVARAVLHPTCLRRDTDRQLQKKPGSLHAERLYQYRSFLPQHKTNMEHYQLRNMVAASNRSELFYASRHCVKRAALALPNEIETVLDLAKPSNCASDFRITCLSASTRSEASNYRTENVLIAGGWNGEYAILNLDGSRKAAEGFVTHAYNGLVTHAHSFDDRRSGLLRAAFCSNDCKVRLMDIPTLRFTDTFSYDSAINCSATSPDGRLRVLAGDSQDVHITDAERGDTLVTMRHGDHCFACDWSREGKFVATAAQDGSTLIWDSRFWADPVISLPPTSMSCARSVRFTDNGALVVAEDDDVVHVYDGKSGQRQEIRFFGSVAGVALLEGGAEMVIANADKTVGGLLTFERTSAGYRSGAKSTYSASILDDVLV